MPDSVNETEREKVARALSYPTKREREMRGFPAESEDEHHG